MNIKIYNSTDSKYNEMIGELSHSGWIFLVDDKEFSVFEYDMKSGLNDITIRTNENVIFRGSIQ